MRVAIGSMMQETNTLVPFKTTLDTFKSYYLRRGQEVLDGYGAAKVEVPGFLSVLREAGIEPVPLLATHAMAGGYVTREAFGTLLDEMIDRLRKAGSVDGVLLALHGSMAVEDEPDGEGEILERVRAVLPAKVPIGVSLDLHGHITKRMLQPNTFLIGYREYPHIDMFETGERVARLLIDTMAGRKRPVMAMAKRHMIVSPVNSRTGMEPLSRIVAEGRRMEAAGEILHASLFPVQPWLDVPDLGFSALVCADGDRAAAQRAAEKLADMAWDARDEFEPDLSPLEDAIRVGLTADGTTVISDVGDSSSGGAAADNTTVLQALLKAGADKAGRLTYLTLCDAEAVREAAKAGPGAKIALRVGHKLTPAEGQPVTINATVRSISDGIFTMYDGGAQGSETSLGLTAVLAVGDLRIALRSLPSFEWDTGMYTAFGLDLRRASMVFVKSPSHFRTAYTPHATRIIIADTPGPTCGNMRKLKLSRVTRPLFPLDDLRNDPDRRR